MLTGAERLDDTAQEELVASAAPGVVIPLQPGTPDTAGTAPEQPAADPTQAAITALVSSILIGAEGLTSIEDEIKGMQEQADRRKARCANLVQTLIEDVLPPGTFPALKDSLPPRKQRLLARAQEAYSEREREAAEERGRQMQVIVTPPLDKEAIEEARQRRTQ